MSLFDFFRNLFVHKPAPKPITVTQPVNKDVAVIVFGANNQPLAGVKVRFDGADDNFPPTNSDGYTIATVPYGLSASQLFITASGYNDYSVHVDIPAHNQDFVVGGAAKPGQIQLPNLISKHFDPSTISLRDLAKIRGAMWSVRGPWQFGPRPGKDDNITALEFFPSYGSDPFNLTDEQNSILKKYKSYGYTHCAFGPPNGTSYHGQYPDHDFTTSPEEFDRWLDWVQVFWDNGLAPILFLHPDGWSFDQTKALYEPLIRNNPKAQRLMRIIVPSGWEPAGYNWSSYTWTKFFQWGRDILPNALNLVHNADKSDGSPYDAFVGTDEAGDDNGKPVGEAWTRQVPYLHGWLIQVGPYDGTPSQRPANAAGFAGMFDKGQLGADQHGFAWHFKNGISGWPTGSAWGPNEMIYLYAGEVTAFNSYWANVDYGTSVSWGDYAMQNGADGYLDGGSVPVLGR